VLALTDEPNVIELTTQIVAAYVGRNHLTVEDLQSLIASVHGALSGAGHEPPPAAAPKLTRAQIRKSIGREGLVSFEDGRSYRTLRRHLAVRGLTPAEYFEKWGLPKDYPLVAPAYSEQRSAMARALGLGRRAVPTPPPAPAKKPRAKEAAATAAQTPPEPH
jgi:predicted transcriptional regulator